MKKKYVLTVVPGYKATPEDLRDCAALIADSMKKISKTGGTRNDREGICIAAQYLKKELGKKKRKS